MPMDWIAEVGAIIVGPNATFVKFHSEDWREFSAEVRASFRWPANVEPPKPREKRVIRVLTEAEAQPVDRVNAVQHVAPMIFDSPDFIAEEKQAIDLAERIVAELYGKGE
jgi:hypothetical protein